MIWWKHLYMGDKAAAGRPAILEGIRRGRRMPGVYVITLPESGNHILDIRPVSLLTEKERGDGAFLMLLSGGLVWDMHQIALGKAFPT